MTSVEADTYDVHYEAKYLKGYPGWKKDIDGYLILKKSKEGNKVIFSSRNDGKWEIAIPGNSIGSIEIIPDKDGDHMIQVVCQDERKTFASPIFRLEQKELIPGIVYGISTLAGVSEMGEEPDTSPDGMNLAMHNGDSSGTSTTTKLCINCGTELTQDARFCSQCGVKQT
jgi:hypothetical protein